jgi:uncharacterized protein (UPF0264 family)
VPGVRCKPKLLVSVRNLEEFRSVRDVGVDVIDLKEPRNGPLAPVDPSFWIDAAGALGQSPMPSRCLLSAALGESAEARIVARNVPPSFSFAKVGPSGCTSRTLLRQTWREVREDLDDQVELVAVAYADSDHAKCLPPEQVFAEAAEAGFRLCLIDTYTKDGRSSLDHLGTMRLQRLGLLSGQLRMRWALAGSIGRTHLAQLAAQGIDPDFIGVRGDVCHRGRTGDLDPQQVQLWQQALRSR